jgi:8-oxo-dGTP diphosphatase
MVVAAVVVCGGRVLLARRRVGEGRLSWQFPAGKLHPGESVDSAAVRETLEETGLTVRAVSHLGQRVHPDTGRKMVYVACEVVGGTAFVAAPEEIADVAWCDRATLAAYVPYPIFGPAQRYLDGMLPGLC